VARSWLENVPLKEPDLESWQVFISESQERMVLAGDEKDLPAAQARRHLRDRDLTELGKADGSGILKVMHHGTTVCELDVTKLHEAPRREMRAKWRNPPMCSPPCPCVRNPGPPRSTLLSDFSIVSREPIIREYDHEVQGNTVLKPLAGAAGDAPQDGSVIRVDGSNQLVSLACALLPEWGKTDPHLMGRACRR
jgi:phosphoribosylformylglycinamidine (FGAM) synthase-like enzyme